MADIKEKPNSENKKNTGGSILCSRSGLGSQNTYYF